MTLYGMVTNRNAGAERLHGYTAREVLGRWPRGITIGVKNNGRRIDVSITLSPIRDAEGKIVGASSIARRITYRRKAAAVIMGYAQLLEALSRIRDRQADEAVTRELTEEAHLPTPVCHCTRKRQVLLR